MVVINIKRITKSSVPYYGNPLKSLNYTLLLSSRVDSIIKDKSPCKILCIVSMAALDSFGCRGFPVLQGNATSLPR